MMLWFMVCLSVRGMEARIHFFGAIRSVCGHRTRAEFLRDEDSAES